MSEHNTAPPAQDENQLIAERREKLKTIRQHQREGKGPAFPNDFKPADRAADLFAAHAGQTSEGLLWVVHHEALSVFDVSDPTNPVPVGHFDTVPYGGDDAQMDGSWSNYPYFQSGIVVVTSGREGLFIVRYRPRAVSQ